MIKLVVLAAAAVLFATCVYAAPTPGFLSAGYALPAATSYSSRIDVHHSKPIIATYAAPVIAKTIVAAPIAYGHHEPIISGYGYGLGHGYGYDYGHGWW